MRSLKITPENLKNQQDVVSEEVRVNVLNQPYGAFEWLGLPQKANTNWYNAHNFYGDLSDLQAATLEDVKKFFDTYYAPNNAVLVVAGDTTPDEVMKLAEKHFGGIPSRPLPPRPDISRAAADGGEDVHRESDKLARTPALAFGYHLPERMTRGLLRAVAARSAAGQRREREAVSGADQGEPDRVERVRRLQLRARQQLRLQRPDALHLPGRLPSGPEGRGRAEGRRQGDQRGAGARHHRRGAAGRRR